MKLHLVVVYENNIHTVYLEQTIGDCIIVLCTTRTFNDFDVSMAHVSG